MSKIIKNPSRVDVMTTFMGRPILLKAKHSMLTPDNPQGDALADYLLQTFQFLQDKTPKVEYPIKSIKKARGVKKI